MGIKVLHICLDDDHDVHVVAVCLGLGICTLLICIIGGGLSFRLSKAQSSILDHPLSP